MRIQLYINNKTTIIEATEVCKGEFEDILYFESNKYLMKVEFKPDISPRFYLNQLLKTGYLDLTLMGNDLLKFPQILIKEQ